MCNISSTKACTSSQKACSGSACKDTSKACSGSASKDTSKACSGSDSSTTPTSSDSSIMNTPSTTGSSPTGAAAASGGDQIQQLIQAIMALIQQLSGGGQGGANCQGGQCGQKLSAIA